MTELVGKRFVLGITGGIAAYKAAELTRLLVKAGASRRCGDDRVGHAFRQPDDFSGPVRAAGVDQPVGWLRSPTAVAPWPISI